jgi:hypothetical protein
MLPTLTHRTNSHPLPVKTAPYFVGTQPFERFGSWAPPVHIARDGTIGRLARWLTLECPQGVDDSTAWELCRAANPECFRTYRVVALDQPSFFLPAGEVAFEAIENPTQIPDRPPQGVMLRHLEAMDAFASATFHFLRPVFVIEPALRLATVDELRREAYFDQFDALRLARHFGWAYRSQAWLARQRDAAALFALRSTTRLVEGLGQILAPTLPPRHTIDSTPHPRGLAQESRRLEFALSDLRRRMTIDPVLAFEVASRPGELWFEAHWYAATDGRTYVHY